MPVPWTDGSTPVNAANLEIMEADIAAVKVTADAAQPTSAKGVANGYASLDSGGQVPDAQIPAAVARDAEVTSAISAHAAAADPHTGYQKESEKGVASGYAPLGADSLVPAIHLPAAASSLPIGATVMWPSAAAVPSGWMKCDGSAIPGGLTAAIAVLGANVPDMRGRAPFGVDTGLALAANDGKASGSRGPTHKHTFTNPTVASHSHGGGVHGHGITDPGHTHTHESATYAGNNGNIAASNNVVQNSPHTMSVSGTGISVQNSAAVIGAEAPATSGGAAGPAGSQLIDIVAYFGLHFIVYVGP